jgi:hypothetical protein
VSITIEYYLNSSLELPALAEQLSSALGCDLKPYEGNENDYFARFMGMELSLEPYTEENDGDLEFEAYNHQLSFRTSWGGAHWRPIQLPTMLAAIYVLHQRFGYTGMLVYDLDILLARYDEQFVDTLSGTSLTDFTAHLTAVTSRLPDGAVR